MEIPVQVPVFSVNVPGTDLTPVLDELATVSQQVAELRGLIENQQVPEPEPEPEPWELPAEMRGVRGQCGIATTRERAEYYLGKLAEARVTDWWYPTVVSAAGEAYWRTNLIPRASCVTDEYDPLATVIDVAGGLGIRVHSLVIAAYTPLSHPEWDLANTRGIDEHWLDFTIPEARQFLADCCAEIADGYQEVHSIALDYCRYQYTWADRLGLTCDSIVAAVGEIRDRVHNVRPEMPVGQTPSAAVVFAETWWKQPWASMLNNRIIRYAQPMCYQDEDATREQIPVWIAEWDEHIDADKHEYIFPRPPVVWFAPDFKRKSVERVLWELEQFAERWPRRALYDDYRIAAWPELIEALAAGGW